MDRPTGARRRTPGRTSDVDRRPDPYDREVLPPPGILLVALLIALIVLVPARRLQLAGVSSRTIGLYALGLWALATLVAIRPGATRILVPILLVAYLAPFVAAPDAVARFLRRGRGGTDRAERRPGSTTDEERHAAGRPPGRWLTRPRPCPARSRSTAAASSSRATSRSSRRCWRRPRRASRTGEPIRIAVVPTAAARGRPDLAAANGVAAFERVAAGAGRPVRAASVPVVDAASAADPELADQLRGRAPHPLPRRRPGPDPAHPARDRRPGGDRGGPRRRRRPGRRECRGDGDGAVHLDARTGSWPARDRARAWSSRRMRTRPPGRGSWRSSARWLPPGIGLLGLAERTGVIVSADEPWLVAGEGEVRWLRLGHDRDASSPGTATASTGRGCRGPRSARLVTGPEPILAVCATDLGWRLDPAVTFLNHGSLRGLPRADVLAAHQALRDRLERRADPLPDARAARALSTRLASAVGAFLSADPDGLAFVPNATTGVNTVLPACSVRAGRRAADQRPRVQRDHQRDAADGRADRGAGGHRARSPSPSPARTRSWTRCWPPSRRGPGWLVVSHVTSPTALVLPDRAARRASSTARGIDTLVDGPMRPGWCRSTLDAPRAAYWTGNGHKWLCGPKGTGFLWVRADRREADPPARRVARRERTADRTGRGSASSSTGSGRPTRPAT